MAADSGDNLEEPELGKNAAEKVLHHPAGVAVGVAFFDHVTKMIYNLGRWVVCTSG